MGKAEAYEFAVRGYDVIIHYGNSKESTEKISKDIEEKYGVRTALIQADLSKEEEVRALASKALAAFGKVDVLVNNAEMAKNKYGKIVNIATIDVMTTYNAESAEYDESKAALISLTKTSSLQFAPYVNVNCVCPGWTATDMNKDLPQELLDYQASKTCKGRMAKPEEVAKMIAFLASDDAEFIDGEVIKIDGGYKLG